MVSLHPNSKSTKLNSKYKPKANLGEMQIHVANLKYANEGENDGYLFVAHTRGPFAA